MDIKCARKGDRERVNGTNFDGRSIFEKNKIGAK